MLCPHCAQSVVTPPLIELPVEPLFNRVEVCMLVPVKNTTLARWISKHPGVLDRPFYAGPRTRSRRLFTARDIRVLRAALVRSKP
jgi:hypothetical protein